MEEQRTLDGAGKDDKQSLLALVSEVRPTVASTSGVGLGRVRSPVGGGGFPCRLTQQQEWCVVPAPRWPSADLAMGCCACVLMQP
jgi:hypothetical protein